MPSLDKHFRALTTVRPPSRWPDLEDLETPTSLLPERRFSRALVVLLALILGVVPFLVVIRAFRTDGENAATSSTLARNGLIAFSRGGGDPGLYVVNSDGTQAQRVTSSEADTDPAWSPDGRRIAFVHGFVGGRAGIYLMQADGSDAVRITDGGTDVDGTDLGPAWSPDGTRIAFAREGRPADAETGNTDLYVVDVVGGAATQLTDDTLMEYAPAWSPDGSRIAFIGYRLAAGGEPPSAMRLYVMNVDGSGRKTVGPSNVDAPSWSPDGSEIAFVDTETGWLMAIHPDGSGERRILDAAALVGGVHLVSAATWSPDGRQIAFMAGPDATDTHIYVVDRDGSNVRQVTLGPAPDVEPAWQIAPESNGSPSPTATESSPSPSPSAATQPGVFGAMDAAIRASVPAGWQVELVANRLDGDWNLDGDVDDGFGAGRLLVNVTAKPGNLTADPCADAEFRQGGTCVTRRLADGSTLVLRGVVKDPGGMRTIEVVLIHPDRSGISAEAGNWTLSSPAGSTDHGGLPMPRVTRPDPLFSVADLARLVQEVERAIR